MRIFSFCLAVILAFSFPFGVLADEDRNMVQNTAYLTYEYDASRSLIILSVNYCGEGISAIGAVVEYDSSIVDYTSYTRGDFEGFNLSATLDNSGNIRILAYGSENLCRGEIVRLCFKIKDFEAKDYFFSLSPLTDSPAAAICDGGVKSVRVSFTSVSCSTAELLPQMEFAGIAPSGKIILVCDIAAGQCFFDITVVELSGEIRKDFAFAKRMNIRVPGADVSCFSLDIGDMPEDYAAIIVNPYYIENNEKLCFGQGIYLFCDGEYID